MVPTVVADAFEYLVHHCPRRKLFAGVDLDLRQCFLSTAVLHDHIHPQNSLIYLVVNLRNTHSFCHFAVHGPDGGQVLVIVFVVVNLHGYTFFASQQDDEQVLDQDSVLVSRLVISEYFSLVYSIVFFFKGVKFTLVVIEET